MNVLDNSEPSLIVMMVTDEKSSLIDIRFCDYQKFSTKRLMGRTESNDPQKQEIITENNFVKVYVGKYLHINVEYWGNII